MLFRSVKFHDAKRKVEKKTPCTKEELKEAEAILIDAAEKFGFLIIHGDLLRYILVNVMFSVFSDFCNFQLSICIRLLLLSSS